MILCWHQEHLLSSAHTESPELQQNKCFIEFN